MSDEKYNEHHQRVKEAKEDGNCSAAFQPIPLTMARKIRSAIPNPQAAQLILDPFNPGEHASSSRDSDVSRQSLHST